MKLTASKIKALQPGKASGDGRNLWIVASDSGRKRWEFRYTISGKRRAMGLGPWPEVTLDKARDRALELRRQLLEGTDPLASKQLRQPHQPRSLTLFKEVAEEAIRRWSGEWKSPKQEPQWRSSLERYAYPILGNMHVGVITPEHVRDVLEPIWHAKAPTAERVHNRIERILDYATVLKLRSGDNPARWKGNLEHMLARRDVPDNNFSALPYERIAGFMADLRQRAGIAARALELVILTATRTNEVTNARWSEIDLENAIWVIPSERMKTKKTNKAPHRVPLSKQAIELLKALPRDSVGDYVFMGAEPGKPIATDLRRVLVRMERTDITAHGFRSTFRDWVSDRTSYPEVLAEKALAHKDTNKVQAAYRRTDMFEKRIPLMQDWANYCDGIEAGGTVVPLKVAG